VSGVVFSSVELNPDAVYVLYVGELKSHCLNEFVREALRRRLGTHFDIISIVPDVLAGYTEPNLVVINPQARRLSEQMGRTVALRPPVSEFLRHVSESEFVRGTVGAILTRQDVLYVWMFESRPELALLDMEGVRLLGPDPLLARKLNGKPWQYETFHGLIPIPDYRVCHGRRELLAVTSELLASWSSGLFISLEHSAGGAQSMIARTSDEVAARFADAQATYLVTRYMPHVHDPTTLAVVANERDVFVAGVADQRIESGNRFCGSTCPAALPAALQEELCDCTRLVGRKLGELGYRGIFGCDYIVDARGQFRLVEVNARKQGTTMEFCCALEAGLPPGAPNLPELEYCAVVHSEFPEDMEAPRPGAASLHWGTFNLKANEPVVTRHFLEQEMPERGLFRRVASGGQGGCLFLEHVGADMHVEPGCFVGRVVAVDSSRQGMLSRLQQGREQLAGSILAP